MPNKLPPVIEVSDPLLEESPDSDLPEIMAHGYHTGATLRQFLAANVRHVINVMQLATYAILIFQLAHPNRYNAESCSNGSSLEEDVGLVSYFWGFLIALLGINLINTAIESTSHDPQAASTAFRIRSELTDAIGTSVYLYQALPQLGLKLSASASLSTAILSGFYPIACLIMRCFNKEFARGDWEDYQYYFENSTFKRRLGIILESLSNGLSLASTLAMVSALIMDVCYNAWHEENLSPNEYNRFMLFSTNIGFLLGVILTKKNNWQTIMNKVSTAIDMFYVTYLVSLRLQGCITPKLMYDPRSFQQTGWKYAAGWGTVAVAFSAASWICYIDDTYNAIALERWLIKEFKCDHWNCSLRKIITNVVKKMANLPIKIINATLSPPILREPAYEGYMPVLTEEDHQSMQRRHTVELRELNNNEELL